jgi:hypothetical protein
MALKLITNSPGDAASDIRFACTLNLAAIATAGTSAAAAGPTWLDPAAADPR